MKQLSVGFVVDACSLGEVAIGLDRFLRTAKTRREYSDGKLVSYVIDLPLDGLPKALLELEAALRKSAPQLPVNLWRFEATTESVGFQKLWLTWKNIWRFRISTV